MAAGSGSSRPTVMKSRWSTTRRGHRPGEMPEMQRLHSTVSGESGQDAGHLNMRANGKEEEL